MNDIPWHRLALRPTRTQALIGLVFIALGLLATMALRGQSATGPLVSARNEDLVQVLDDLTSRRDRLEVEARRLEVAQQAITSGEQGQALAEAQRRAAALEVLAGTTPVNGPGITVTFAGQAPASVVLDAVQELRDAGAEAIAVGGIRVVASTWIGTQGESLVVSGTTVPRPVTITAIGDPTTMTTAMSIPGGVVDSVHAAGEKVALTTVDVLSVPALPPVGGAG